MTRRAFRQADVTRAIKAARAAGGGLAVVVHPRSGLIEIKAAELTKVGKWESDPEDSDADLEALAKRHGYG